MKPGTRIRLVAFNGSAQAPPDVKRAENYWALIGQKGTVLGFNTQLGRYLVRFDEPVQALGLHGHNPEPNSLYILRADLAPLEGADQT